MGLKILLRVLLFFVFLVEIDAYSQDLFVGANAYVYVKNQYVFLQNNLELNATTSNFYLRGGGQLLQGTSGAGSNKGLGNLSVFQEGTANNYHYNYWCSPVGNVNSLTNSFGISQLGSPKNSIDSTPAIILPLSVDDGEASPLSIASSWIYKFVAQGSYSGWLSAGAGTSIAPGEGFTMKGTSGIDETKVDGVQNNPGGQQRYDFRGKPNDGTIKIRVLPEQITLTGNPYPSAIDLQAFLIKETNCTGIAYFWEEDQKVNSHYIEDYKGGYGAYSPVGGADGNGVYVSAAFCTYDSFGNSKPVIGSSGKQYDRRYSPIGQGFLIEGKVDGSVEMKNEYRVFMQEGNGNYSEFARSNEKAKSVTKNASEPVIPQIRFNTLIDNGPVSQMVVAFDPSSTINADHAMDALSQNDGPANNYFVVDDKEYVIDVLPFDANNGIPIGFRNSAQANYKITVHEMLNFPEDTNVYLHNKLTDLYYDIKNSFYDLTLAPGIYNSQYEITFKDKNSLGVNDVNVSGRSFFVNQDNVNKLVKIRNPLRLELESYSLYDVTGKIVFTKGKLGTDECYVFSTSGLTDGIYIVRIVTADKTESGTKIIIRN